MEEKVIQISGSITVDELANALGVSVTHLIGELFKNGIMATINQRLDAETAQIMTEELGFTNVRFEKKENSATDPSFSSSTRMVSTGSPLSHVTSVSSS